MTSHPISVMFPATGTAAEFRTWAAIAEQAGVEEIWVQQFPDQRDAGIVAAEFLRASTRVRVGTAVLPVYARHPLTMAQLALSLDDLSDGRFVLGLGLGHQITTEVRFGYRQGPPIGVMREYLTIVRRVIRDGTVDYEGRYFTARADYRAPRRPNLPIYLAGLRPQMIRLAAQLADGLVLWMCTPRYIREQVIPVLRAACAEIGRDPSRFPVLTLLPIYVGPDYVEHRERLRVLLEDHLVMPVYRRVVEAAGFRGGQVGHELLDAIAAAGPVAHVRQRIVEFCDVGVTPVLAPGFTGPVDLEATLAALR